MRRAVGVGLILVLMLGTACGPSLVEFIALADAICKKYEKVFQALSAPDSVAKIKEFSEKLAETDRDMVRELNALDKPRGDEGNRANSVINKISAAGTAAGEVAEAAGKEDLPATEKSVDETRKAHKEADDEGRSAGFKVCGKAGAAAAEALGSASAGILKNALIAKADARCAVTNREADALAEPQSLRELADYFEKVRVMLEKMVTDVRAMPPASADKAAVDEWLAELDRGLAKLAEARDAAQAGQEERSINLAAEFDEIVVSADQKADRFGFRDCGSAGTT